MQDWISESIRGGRSWSGKIPGTDGFRRVTVVKNAQGIWLATALSIRGTRIRSGAFDSQLEDDDGLDRCLAWAREFLVRQNEVDFDAAAARAEVTSDEP